MINLGCSARVAADWNNVDFSWLLTMGRHLTLSKWLNRSGLLSDERYRRILALDGALVLWDLRRGIPFDDDTFDVAYHSHVLEHIDRDGAPTFITECRRVLKVGGVMRVVVPDLEALARRYVHALDAIDVPGMRTVRDETVDGMIEQMIVRTPTYRRAQPRVVRMIESVLIGNTDRAGILHRWMYDRESLRALLQEYGFGEITVRSFDGSQVEGWNAFLLDRNADGTPYKADSLYIEAQKL